MMDRRRFLQTVAAGAAVANTLEALADQKVAASAYTSTTVGSVPVSQIDVSAHTLICSFSHNGEAWKVYEDLRTRDGAITFVSASGHARVMPKSAEASFASEGPQHLGLDIKDIGMAGPDLLADKLLEHGDPKEEQVRAAAPPMHSTHPTRRTRTIVRHGTPSWARGSAATRCLCFLAAIRAPIIRCSISRNLHWSFPTSVLMA